MKEILQTAELIITKEHLSTTDKLQELCSHLNNSKKKYTWVGFYFMNHEKEQLHLGPYIGEPTDHTIIPFGKGICGQVAVSGQTYAVKDVGEESNYIACSVDVKSEIVVPIYHDEKLVAQLDIDSNEMNAFLKEDQQMLEDICRSVGDHLGNEMHYENYFSSM